MDGLSVKHERDKSPWVDREFSGGGCPGPGGTTAARQQQQQQPQQQHQQQEKVAANFMMVDVISCMIQRKIAIDFCGPSSRVYVASVHPRTLVSRLELVPDGRTQYKRRLLERLGWFVYFIEAEGWYSLDRDDKEEQLDLQNTYVCGMLRDSKDALMRNEAVHKKSYFHRKPNQMKTTGGGDGGGMFLKMKKKEKEKVKMKTKKRRKNNNSDRRRRSN